MLLGLEIGMFIVGVMAVFRGRLKVWQHFEVFGGGARLAGLIMMLPVPVAAIGGFVIGFHAAVEGRAFDFKDNRGTYAAIEMGITLFCLVVAGLVASIADKTPRVEQGYDKEGLPKLPPEVQALLDNPQPAPVNRVAESRYQLPSNDPDAAWLQKDVSFEEAMQTSVPKPAPPPPASFRLPPALIGIVVAAVCAINAVMVHSRLPINDAAPKAAKKQSKFRR